MAETGQDFDLYAGETKTVGVTIRNKSASNALVDLSGASMTWVARRGSSTAISKTIGGGITVTGTGTCDIALAAGDSTSLSGEYEHEARVTLASGTIATHMIGKMTVHATIIP